MGASSAVVGLPCRQLERGRKPCFLCDAPAPEDNARPVRAGKTASIDILSVGRRHSFERHCGSVRSMPHGSFVGDTTPRVPSDATFGALNRRTRGLKSRPVSITRLQRRTNRLSSGWIPSHMLPRTSQPRVRLLCRGLYPRESCLLHAILRPVVTRPVGHLQSCRAIALVQSAEPPL
jgi:hypothetical protein